MSYASMGALADDPGFLTRVTSCASEQALIFKDDARPEFANLATAIIQTPGNARGLFELVCVSPSFREVTDSASVPDADILAAVQSVWPVYGAAVYPNPPE
jgi:hypothetical protein